MTLTTPISGRLVVRGLTLDIAYNHTKFDDSSFSNSREFKGVSADALSEEIIHNGPTLMKLYQPVLGVRFFKHSVLMSHIPTM